MAGPLRIEVVYALPERCWRFPLLLQAGATVADALQAADLASQLPGVEPDASRLAVFGRSVRPETVLHDLDRVELLRPLRVDPKQARRRRAGETKA